MTHVIEPTRGSAVLDLVLTRDPDQISSVDVTDTLGSGLPENRNQPESTGINRNQPLDLRNQLPENRNQPPYNNTNN